MQRSSSVFWTAALLVVSGGMLTPAQSGETTLPEFYEAHEIGYVDLNGPQTLAGWLSSIPAGSPMASQARPNRGSGTVSRSTTGFNPMDGRASAPAPAVTRGAPSVGAPERSNRTNAERTNAERTDRQGTGDEAATPTVSQVPFGPVMRDMITRDPETGGWRFGDPLIHFYADSAVTVNVKAGFKGGLPVAWWPRGVHMAERVEFRDVRVDPGLDPVTSEELNLAKWPGLKPLGYMRDAMATPVKLNTKVEGGIAYEGVMRFQPKLTVRQAVKGIYEVRNDSEIELVDAVLIPFGETRGGVALGTLRPGEARFVELQEAKLQPLAPLMAKQLTKTGLFPAEITTLQKLLLTPEFRLNPGARLLARFSDQAWAEHFPLEIAPAPKRLVRVGMLRIFDAHLYNAAADRKSNGRPAPKAQLTGHGSAKR